MKHLKPVNRKARRIGEAKEAVPAVEPQGAVPFMHTCTSVLNPGYEIDFANGMTQLCTPIETDLFGTTDMFCWWPGQAPDTINNPEWNAECARAMKDWMKLKVVKPEW